MDTLKKKRDSKPKSFEFDQNAYDNAMKKIEGKMKSYTDAYEFEKCIPLREKKKKLQDIKTKWESESGSAELQKNLKDVIKSI